MHQHLGKVEDLLPRQTEDHLKNRLSNHSECQPKTITGLTKEKTLEYKTKRPEESSLNWKPLPNDWAVTTSKTKEVQTNNPEDNMYRYNRKGFLEDDDNSDDSFFIVDPRWDDYCLQELKMNRLGVLLRFEVVQADNELAVLGLGVLLQFEVVQADNGLGIPMNAVGLIEDKAHPFWKQKYSPSDERDRTPRWCSCERMEARLKRYEIFVARWILMNANHCTWNKGLQTGDHLKNILSSHSECQPKTITGLTKEKTLEYKTKKPEESSLNWKPLPNDWAVTTSKTKEVQTNNPEDNMYRYNRKGFLEDDDNIGLIEDKAHPFWKQKYSPSDEHDRTPRCCSCERMEARLKRYEIFVARWILMNANH
nr:protein DA1-related 1 isoform X1 [Tanacetum cinerariifolium]